MAADERRRKILEALSVRRYETCDNLAFEFGVSVRTIYNDLLHLSREYPIYTSQGHKGGIRMMEHLPCMLRERERGWRSPDLSKGQT